MRLNFLLVALACTLILVAVAVYIFCFAFKTVQITEWTNMGVFCAGIAAVITGLAWQKVQQKKVENGTPKKE